MNFDKLRERMKELPYPPNHTFDPETLIPTGETKNRMITLRSRALELFEGDGSLLDVGCNKGFMSFWLRESYDKIVGCDINSMFIQFAIDLSIAHDIDHINFLHCRFEDLPQDVYDVVHFGQCNHYIFRDAVRRGKYPLSFLQKAKAMASKIIAIDGPFSIEDPSMKFDSEHDKWYESTKQLCCIEYYIHELKPEFKLKSYNWSGDGGTRYIAIFERKKESPV